MANVTLGWGGKDFSLSWNRDKVKFSLEEDEEKGDCMERMRENLIQQEKRATLRKILQ